MITLTIAAINKALQAHTVIYVNATSSLMNTHFIHIVL